MSNDDWDKGNTGNINVNVNDKQSVETVYFMKDVNPASALNARDWSENEYSRMDSNSRYWTRDGEEEEEDFGGGRRIRQSKKRQGGSRLRRGATKRSGGSRKKRRGSRKKRGTK